MEEYLQDQQQLRTVAVQIAGDPRPFAGVGADRAWVGVRGCCDLFLALCADGTIGAWLADAAKVGRGVGLSTPMVVPQNRFDQVVSAIMELAPAFDRVMTGDMGVATAVVGRVRVTWCGRVLNTAHAEYLCKMGVDGVRALSPVSTACKDINHAVDLEMPAFGRIPLAFLSVCLYQTMDRDFDCPGACVSAVAGAGGESAAGAGPAGEVGAEPVVLSTKDGAVGVRPCFLESRDFLDLSTMLKPFGRDTCAVIETSGLTPAEVAQAVDALRHGEAVPTTRPLFFSEAEVCPLPSGL